MHGFIAACAPRRRRFPAGVSRLLAAPPSLVSGGRVILGSSGAASAHASFPSLFLFLEVRVYGARGQADRQRAKGDQKS
jgi:hypothetical protein